MAAADNRFAPVSIWRTLHAANEWAELQTQRRLCLPLVLLVMVAIMQAGNLQYVAVARPGTSDISPGTINPLLQFANNVFWWLVVAGIQLLWTVAIHERYIEENPSSSFIDVCTVAKVSLLIMDERYHGYYLHANAPHEHSDGTMTELGQHLFEEAAAMRVGRGLPGSPDASCQTFELHVPAFWRDMYDRVYRRLLEADASGAGESGGASAGVRNAAAIQQMQLMQAAGGAAAAATSVTANSKFARARDRTQRLGVALAALAAFLRGFIEETDPDYKRVWRQRTLVQQLLDLPPDMLTESLVAGTLSTSVGAGAMVSGGGAGMGVGVGAGAGGPGGAGRVTYMMTDKAYRFERVMFRGIELDLLIWDILVYCVTDYSLQSPTIAAAVTYVVALALAWLRTHFGQRNIAFKTLIDERFLS